LMIEHVESEEALANFARFMPDKEKKEDIREKIATDSRGAFIWGVWVPEDSDVVKDKIQGSKWAYRWAKHVGDAEEMLKRADHPYWRNKIKAEAIEYESASFH